MEDREMTLQHASEASNGDEDVRATAAQCAETSAEGQLIPAEVIYYLTSGIWLLRRAGFAHVTPTSRSEKSRFIYNSMRDSNEGCNKLSLSS